VSAAEFRLFPHFRQGVIAASSAQRHLLNSTVTANLTCPLWVISGPAASFIFAGAAATCKCTP
jgi:hypothetical protein